MHVSTVVSALAAIAPNQFAEPWDNTGLICGEAHMPVRQVLCTIDLTEAVVQEAMLRQCQMIVTYHPPFLAPTHKIASEGAFWQALRQGLAVYSAHTAWDAAVGGGNDVLSDILDLQQRRALKAVAPDHSQLKLVFFVPNDAAWQVCEPLLAAGAGVIGNYSYCSAQILGTGTFLPGAQSNPVIGKPGELTHVAETRVEMLIPQDRATEFVALLRAHHPYEEVAFDLLPRFIVSEQVGMGRVGKLLAPMLLHDVVESLKQALGLKHVLVAGAPTHLITDVAVCVGAGDGLLPQVLAAGADLYVTGELRHHQVLKSLTSGVSVLATLHSHSERLSLPFLARALLARLPELQILCSHQDTDPWRIV